MPKNVLIISFDFDATKRMLQVMVVCYSSSFAIKSLLLDSFREVVPFPFTVALNWSNTDIFECLKKGGNVPPSFLLTFEL